MRHLSPTEQPEQLVRAVNRAGMHHGELSRLSVSNVNVVPVAGGTEIRFCSSKVDFPPLVLNRGGLLDRWLRKKVPESGVAIIDSDSKLPATPGLYRLRNALAHSNGRLTITIDEATSIERMDVPPPTPVPVESDMLVH